MKNSSLFPPRRSRENFYQCVTQLPLGSAMHITASESSVVVCGTEGNVSKAFRFSRLRHPLAQFVAFLTHK